MTIRSRALDRVVAVGCFMGLLVGSMAKAAPTDDATARYFRQATRADVNAAWRFLRDNHPGAAREVGDAEFLQVLDRARALALRRVPRVSSFAGYVAVLSGFDNVFRDKHVRTVFESNVARPSWTGLLVGDRDGRWVVVDEDVEPARASLRGSTIEECDGRAVDAIAQERLGGFRADWTNEAQRGQSAPWLLIDDGNPFLVPLARCSFRTAGGELRSIDLHWTPVPRDRIAARIAAASGIGAAGYGVTAWAGGWWIAIQELTAGAPAVLREASRHQDALRAAPFVVVDLRGNGGGSSVYGDELATILYGIPTDADAGCPEAWRTSPGNIAYLESYRTLMGDRMSAAANAQLADDLGAMKASARAGRAFSRPLRCTPAAPPPVPAGPRTLVLTDRACFSSCLLVVRRLLQLGAIQIGETTDADTHYQEVRRQPLPSRLASFSTLSAVDLTLPRRVGPYVPTYRFDGDLTDRDAVQRWIGETVLPALGR